MFYAGIEYNEMKEARRRAVKDVHMRYELLSSGAHCDDDEGFRSCTLIGIENILTPDIVEKLVIRRTECIRAVLDEQARQDDSGEYDPDRLAHLSLIRSVGAAKRARQIASHEYVSDSNK